MEEVWSRPNRVGAVSLISTLSPTLVNEFNFSANSDGKGDIEFGSYCTTCLRSAYGLNYPLLFPGTKIAPDKVPSIRIQGMTTLDAGPYPGSWSGYVYGWTNTTTKVIGSHTIKWGAYFEHSGQNDFIQGTTAGPGQTVNQNGDFTFQRHRQSQHHGPRRRQRHPRQFRYLCRIRRQSLHALRGELARPVRAG